jgi:UDP:flavonoid glycosyltransferase YjiC (YdhE family)
MRIRVITVGSQGDVRPYVAFGAGLRNAGHHVRIVAHPGFEDLVRGNGLDFAPVAGDPRDLEENRQFRALHDDSRNILRWWRIFNEVTAPLMRQQLRDCWDACGDAEVIVVSTLSYLLGYAIAEKLQVPLVRAFYFPVSPTRAHPAEFVPRWARFGRGFNLATYYAQRQFLWQIVRPSLGRACCDALGREALPFFEPFGELDRRQQLLLYCYSAAVAPPPQDWGSWIDVTGYWFLDRSAEWQSPPGLSAFMDSGPSPVYVGGFGRMTNLDPSELARTVVRALAITGHRAVVLSGWGGLPSAELPPEIFTIDWVPFDWLFPRMAAVVHHGGVGTTAIGLRAGVPTITVPFFLDNFFWGRRVFELGVGPRPIPRNRLEANLLAKALQLATSDPHMQCRAAELSARIRAEDGVARAVVTFDRHFGRLSRSGRPLAASARVSPNDHRQDGCVPADSETSHGREEHSELRDAARAGAERADGLRKQADGSFPFVPATRAPPRNRPR